MTIPLVALITAGTAGLGAATARLFAKNGIRVVVNYSTNAERAHGLVQELQAVSTVQSQEGRTDYHAVKADLSKRDNIGRLVEESVTAMGRLDIIFSNGGWTRLRNINDLDDNVDEEDWDMCFNMNVKSHLWLMHAARKWLAETEGVFITTASLAGVRVSGSSLVRRISGLLRLYRTSLTSLQRHMPLQKRLRSTSSRDWQSRQARG